MACALHPATEPAADGQHPRHAPRAMTRCECAGLSFQEFAARMAATGASVEETARGTGCGGTCSACLPDLLAYLARR